MEHWDAVVVGSGFGGAVTAERLAGERGFEKVLVLERGKPWPPGSFPRTPRALRNGFWDPGKGLLGLFDFWSFTGINALVASGLGGGSLIYANVLFRKPAETFAGDDWPIGLDELTPGYDAVEAVLAPQLYPEGPAPYDQTRKVYAFREAAAGHGTLVDTPLAVAFRAPGAHGPVPGAPLPDDPANVHGLPRRTCTLVGECDVGCNEGAKQTLDHTFLSAARAKGAELRTLCEVVGIVPVPDGGWYVTYRQHVTAYDEVKPELRDPERVPYRTIRARRLILAAGTMGTNRLLLRSRINLPRLSSRVGHRFSSNADLLGFAMHTREPLEMADGPVITSTMRARADDRLIQVQDAGAPAIGEWLFQALDVPATVLAARRVLQLRLWQKIRGRRDTSVGGLLAGFFGSAAASANMLPLLGMGEDVAGGRFTIKGDGLLELSWTERESQAVIDALEEKFRGISHSLGGRYRPVPLAHLITVHGLGGCAMAHDAEHGVVDTTGRAFGYDDLYIADGSVMPGPVGPNPSLTIAAFAHRCAGAILTREAEGAVAA